MEDLQTLWHKAQQREDARGLPAIEIDKIIHQRSRSVFNTFKRTVFWELIFNGLFTLSCAYYGWVSELRKYPVITSAFLVLLIGFVAWQFFFYQRLRRHPYNHDVHCYPQSSISLLRQYVWHYKIVYGVGLPISVVLGFIFGFEISQQGADFPFYELPENSWLIAAISIAGLVTVLGVLHLMIKYFYQKKIDRMQQLIDDLEKS